MEGICMGRNCRCIWGRHDASSWHSENKATESGYNDSYITPILQHDPVSRIRYVSAYPYPILRYTFVPLSFAEIWRIYVSVSGRYWYANPYRCYIGRALTEDTMPRTEWHCLLCLSFICSLMWKCCRLLTQYSYLCSSLLFMLYGWFKVSIEYPVLEKKKANKEGNRYLDKDISSCF